MGRIREALFTGEAIGALTQPALQRARPVELGLRARGDEIENLANVLGDLTVGASGTVADRATDERVRDERGLELRNARLQRSGQLGTIHKRHKAQAWSERF